MSKCQTGVSLGAVAVSADSGPMKNVADLCVLDEFRLRRSSLQSVLPIVEQVVELLRAV